MIKICLSCKTKFEGRKDAKTCSVRCRKRLQRTKSLLQTEAEAFKQSIVGAQRSVEDVVESIKQDLGLEQLDPVIVGTDDHSPEGDDGLKASHDWAAEPEFFDLPSNPSGSGSYPRYQFPPVPQPGKRKNQAEPREPSLSGLYRIKTRLMGGRKVGRPPKHRLHFGLAVFNLKWLKLRHLRRLTVLACSLALVAIAAIAWLGNNTQYNLTQLKAQQEVSDVDITAVNLKLGRLSDKVNTLKLASGGTKETTTTNVSGNGGSSTTDASKLTAGTLSDARLSNLVTLQGNGFNQAGQLVQLTANGSLPVLSGVNLTNLDATNLASGTVADARLSTNVTLQGNTFNGISQLVQLTAGGVLPILDGSNLTNVNATTLGGNSSSFYTNASNISSGTLSDGRLSANVTLQGNTFNGISQLVQLTAGGILPILNGSNLTSVNAITLNGATFAAPGAIGGGTAGAGTFTTLTSTSTTDLANTGVSNVTIATTGTGSVNIGNTTGTFTTEAGTGTTALFNGATAHTIQLGTGGAAQTITIGSTNTTSATTIQGGTGASAIGLQAGTAGIISVGTTNVNTVTVGSTANTGTLTFGQSTAGETINIGNGNVATGKTNTINIGATATSTGKDVITIGSLVAASTLTLQGGNTSSAISIQSAASGTIGIATANAANTVQIGNTADAVAQTINIGNNATVASSTALALGNAVSGSTFTAESGTGTTALFNGATAHTIQFATGGAIQTITIGSTNSSSALTLQAGTGNFILSSSGSSTGNILIGGADGITGVATPDLLVLDTKSTTGDPTGTVGAMYYNVALQQFRCYVAVNSTDSQGEWAPCGANPIDRGYVVEDEFVAGSATNHLIGTLGWIAKTYVAADTFTYDPSGLALITGDHFGVLQLALPATATNGTGLWLLGSVNASPAVGQGATVVAANQTWKSTVAVSTSGIASGGALLRAGVTNYNNSSNRPAQGYLWEADTSSTGNGDWEYCYQDTVAGQVCADSGVAVAANTWARLEIRVLSSTRIDFLVNGSIFQVTAANSVLTTSQISPMYQCLAKDASSTASCYLDYMQFRGVASAAR